MIRLYRTFPDDTEGGGINYGELYEEGRLLLDGRLWENTEFVSLNATMVVAVCALEPGKEKPMGKNVETVGFSTGQFNSFFLLYSRKWLSVILQIAY